ncbi:SpoIIE family protein phosphatase [Algivirga pacifica]|uniref:HAMP domain-containing protein n=1 Tax=Algivirga pacifica TaxID=1162670 RepID=A0ABP9D174_9BACT
MKFKISLKLTLLCLLLVIFSSALLFFFNNRETQETLKAHIIGELTDASDQGIENIDRFLYERLTDIRLVANDPVLRTVTSSIQIDERLREMNQLNSDLYYSYSYFDLKRRRLADSKGLSIGKQHSLSKYWLPLSKGKELVMDISKSESVGQPVIHFASVVKDKAGKKKGYVVARVVISKLYEVFAVHSGNELWNSTELHMDLLNNEGVLLYSNYNRQGVLKEKYEDVRLLHLMKEEGLSNLEYRGKLVLLSKEKGYQSFKGNDWTLLMSLPLEEVYKPLNKVKQRMILVLLPILLISILLAILMSRYFSKPIIDLSNAADLIGHGHFETEIQVKKRSDELYVLGDNLKRMADNLKKRDEQHRSHREEVQRMNHELQEKLDQIHDHREEIASQNAALEYAFDELDKRSRQQTASINYAKKIQNSMLPEKKDLAKVFPGSYIYYKPRNIVSGDFYWFEKVEREGEEYFVVAAADCTGHGVPGAIMAMLGSNLLTNIVCYGRILDPAEILRRLNRDVRAELHQDRDESQDGMEIAVATFHLTSGELRFAGAGRPLYLFRNGVLQEFKGHRAHIGGSAIYQKKRPLDDLESVSISIEKGDVLYMFSDGFKDQIGGPKQRVFTSKRMRGVLKELHQRSAVEQLEGLDQVYYGWKGELVQTDDILLMGIMI